MGIVTKIFPDAIILSGIKFILYFLIKDINRETYVLIGNLIISINLYINIHKIMNI